ASPSHGGGVTSPVHGEGGAPVGVHGWASPHAPQASPMHGGVDLTPDTPTHGGGVASSYSPMHSPGHGGRASACPECHSRVEGGERFCASCGTPLV
ncbi:hypothetical protein T484DRAFT_1780284, partial [Baffinella frigidus]